MQNSRGEKILGKAIMVILLAFGIWYLMRPGERTPRRTKGTPEITLETDPMPNTAQATGTLNSGTSENSLSASPTPAIKPALETPPIDKSLPQSALNAQQIEARRSQVKIILGSLFASSVAYYIEYNRYTTDLTALGYMPDNESLPAKFGFLSPYEPRGGREENENPMRTSSDVFLNLQDEDGEQLHKYDAYSKNIDLSKYARFCRDGCTANDSRFEIIAAFNLDTDETLDVWIMDNNKDVRHIVDDTKE